MTAITHCSRRTDGGRKLNHAGLTGTFPFVDHLDGNGLNNQRSNIRRCTHRENGINRRPAPRLDERWKQMMANYKARLDQANREVAHDPQGS